MRAIKQLVLAKKPGAKCRDEAVIVGDFAGRAFVVRDGDGTELGRDIWSSREAWRRAYLGLS